MGILLGRWNFEKVRKEEGKFRRSDNFIKRCKTRYFRLEKYVPAVRNQVEVYPDEI